MKFTVQNITGGGGGRGGGEWIGCKLSLKRLLHGTCYASLVPRLPALSCFSILQVLAIESLEFFFYVSEVSMERIVERV